MDLCRKGSTIDDAASSIIAMISQLLVTLAVVYDAATIPNVQEASRSRFLVVNILGIIGFIGMLWLLHVLSRPSNKLTSNRYYAITGLVLLSIFAGVAMAFFIKYFIYAFSHITCFSSFTNILLYNSSDALYHTFP